MKTFEEKYTAWLDGALSENEREVFEKDHGLEAAEKAEYQKLHSLLCEHRRALPNPDFFNVQIRTQIDRESAVHAVHRRGWLTLPRLAFGGVFTLAIGFALFFTIIPRTHTSNPRSGYTAEVLKTQTVDPKVQATVDNQKEMTIIKLEGLEKVPPEKDLNR
jgi:hypothetical protein